MNGTIPSGIVNGMLIGIIGALGITIGGRGDGGTGSSSPNQKISIVSGFAISSFMVSLSPNQYQLGGLCK